MGFATGLELGGMVLINLYHFVHLVLFFPSMVHIHKLKLIVVLRGSYRKVTKDTRQDKDILKISFFHYNKETTEKLGKFWSRKT